MNGVFRKFKLFHEYFLQALRFWHNLTHMEYISPIGNKDLPTHSIKPVKSLMLKNTSGGHAGLSIVKEALVGTTTVIGVFLPGHLFSWHHLPLQPFQRACFLSGWLRCHWGILAGFPHTIFL